MLAFMNLFLYLGGMWGKGVSPFLSCVDFLFVLALRNAVVVSGILSERPDAITSRIVLLGFCEFG